MTREDLQDALELTYVGHATAQIRLDGTTALTDPLLRRWAGPLRRYAGPVDPEGMRRPDVVLLSHLHIDHVDRPSLSLIGRDAVVLVPTEGVALARRLGFGDVRGVMAHDSITVAGLRVNVVPARHLVRRYPLGGPSDSVGFVLEGSQSVYFAGDTAPFEEMSSLAPRLDLALIPIAGWGPDPDEGEHLNSLTAARCLAQLRPRVAVPIHWGTYAPPGMLSLWHVDPLQPPRAFVRYARHFAPQVDVRLLQPGESTLVEPPAPR